MKTTVFDTEVITTVHILVIGFTVNNVLLFTLLAKFFKKD